MKHPPPCRAPRSPLSTVSLNQQHTQHSSGSFLANVLAWAGFSPMYPGRWIGKAFVGGGAGWGYNVFVWFSARVHRRFKMATSFADSVWDGKPSFQLQYHGQASVWFAWHLCTVV